MVGIFDSNLLEALLFLDPMITCSSSVTIQLKAQEYITTTETMSSTQSMYNTLCRCTVFVYYVIKNI
jgi:hypothetical protein